MVPPPGYDPDSTDFQSVAMTTSAKAVFVLAEGLGIEPRTHESKSCVIPFHHPPTKMAPEAGIEPTTN